MATTTDKSCPMCGAVARASATVCAACGESLFPRNSENRNQVYIEVSATLPLVCAICGDEAIQRKNCQFAPRDGTWCRPVELPLCRRHRFFRPLRSSQIAAVVIGVPAISAALAFPLVALFGETAGILLGAVLIVGSILLAAIYVMWSIRQSHGPYAESGHGTHILLSGIAPEFARACNERAEQEPVVAGEPTTPWIEDPAN
jgi:hypothetical protein